MNQNLSLKSFLVAMTLFPIEQSFAGLNSPSIGSGITNSTGVVKPLSGDDALPPTESGKKRAEEAQVIKKQQDQISEEGTCNEEYPKLVYNYLGNKRKAQCEILARYPGCKKYQCDPAPREKENDTEPATPKTKLTKSKGSTNPKITDQAEYEEMDSGGDDSSDDQPQARKPAVARQTPAKQPTKSQDDSSQKDSNDQNLDNNDNSNDDSSARQAALVQCQSLGSQAANACNVSDSDSYSSSSSSIQQSCTDMQNAGISNGNSKNSQARACNEAFSNCTDFCSTSANRYSETDDWSTFNSQYQQCMGLGTKAAQLSEAAKQSAQASRGGSACDSAASEAPSSSGGGSDPEKAKRELAAAKDEVCTANPQSSECAQLTQYASAQKAVAGFGDAEGGKGATGDPNIASDPTLPSPAEVFAAQNQGGGLKNGTVPNGGGGAGIIGMQIGPAVMGGPAAPAPPPAQGVISSAITAIEKGLLGGGYSEMLAGEKPWKEEDIDTSPLGIAEMMRTRDILRDEKDIGDLKDYLPGGRKYSQPEMRGPASVSEIHGPGVDIFSRISARYRAKCLLGELVGCPEAMQK